MSKHLRSQNRQARIRKKIREVSSLPRLSVHRSNQHIYAQIIDDASHQTVVSVAEKKDGKTGTKTERAKMLGQQLAELAKSKKVTEVVFDKGRFAYHGRVKAFAEGAREGGLKF